MRVVNRFRKEPVDLQPYGNTISVEAPSDNPFEDTRDVEVHTQVSGGMAGPDSAHRSKKIHTKAAQVMPLKNGKVPAMRLNAAANKGFNASFMPGMGDFGGVIYPYNEGGSGGSSTPAVMGPPASLAAPAVMGPPTSLATPDQNTLAQVTQGLVTAADIAARLRQQGYDADMAKRQADVLVANAKARSSEATKKTVVIGLGALGVLGLAWFLLARK